MSVEPENTVRAGRLNQRRKKAAGKCAKSRMHKRRESQRRRPTRPHRRRAFRRTGKQTVKSDRECEISKKKEAKARERKQTHAKRGRGGAILKTRSALFRLENPRLPHALSAPRQRLPFLLRGAARVGPGGAEQRCSFANFGVRLKGGRLLRALGRECCVKTRRLYISFSFPLAL